MKLRRTTRLAAGLMSAAVAAACLPALASARPVPPPAVTPGSTYLALGDSVTFGYQEAAVVPKPNYKRASNFPGYPEQLGSSFPLKVVNLACPGETTDSLINSKAQSNGCENSLGSKVGYRTLYPLHTNYKGSQLAYAVKYLKAHRSVRLVTLMIGANDAFLCQKTTHDGCLSEFSALLKKIGRNVRKIVSAVRNQGRYRGQLVIVNYYSLDYTSALLNLEVKSLNSAQDNAAKPFGAKFADGFGLFKLASSKAGGQPCVAGLVTQFGGKAGACGVHPSYAGGALLAQALARAVRFQ
jgi:lysophospholipase L1-like esterase